MISVEAIADDIIAREGGYVNDPDDPGGATKYGVTIGTMTRLGLDLDGDGRVTPADVKRLSRAQARKIFVDHDFHRIGPRIHIHIKDRGLDRRPASRKYARRRDGGKGGWIIRAEEFISKRYHLSEAEHRKRVSAWA